MNLCGVFCFCSFVACFALLSGSVAAEELPELRIPKSMSPKAASQPASTTSMLYQKATTDKSEKLKQDEKAKPEMVSAKASEPASASKPPEPYYKKLQTLKMLPNAFAENLKTGLPSLSQAQGLAYPPVSNVLVLPIMKLGEQKAFRDVGLLVAEQLGVQLKQALPELQTYSPQELISLLQKNGQTSLYQRFAEAYTLSGNPDLALVEKMVDLLDAKQLNPSTSTVQKGLGRLVVLEANLDFTRPTQPGTKIEWFRKWTTDTLPQTGHAFLETRLRVFELKNGSYQQVWADAKSQSVAIEPMGSMSLSVADNSQAQQLLTTASMALSKRFYEAAPVTFLYEYGSQSSVSAELQTKP